MREIVELLSTPTTAMVNSLNVTVAIDKSINPVSSREMAQIQGIYRVCSPDLRRRLTDWDDRLQAIRSDRLEALSAFCGDTVTVDRVNGWAQDNPMPSLANSEVAAHLQQEIEAKQKRIRELVQERDALSDRDIFSGPAREEVEAELQFLTSDRNDLHQELWLAQLGV